MAIKSREHNNMISCLEEICLQTLVFLIFDIIIFL